MLRLLALLAALALSGCLGGDAPAAAQPPLETANETAAALEEAQEALPPEPVEVPVSVDGRMSDFARACPPAGSCVGTASSRPYSGWIQETPGVATAYRAELSWSAASPATQELGFMAMVCGEDADGATFCEMLAVVQGPSPLALEAQGVDVTPGMMLYLHPYMPNRAPLPMYYELRQDFHIEGVVTVQPPA